MAVELARKDNILMQHQHGGLLCQNTAQRLGLKKALHACTHGSKHIVTRAGKNPLAFTSYMRAKQCILQAACFSDPTDCFSLKKNPGREIERETSMHIFTPTDRSYQQIKCFP
jgi:hypothetical protein